MKLKILMDFRQVALGIVTFLIFWAFQAGYLDLLGGFTVFAAALVISFLPWLVEVGSKRRPSPENLKQMWIFATVFVVVGTLIISIAPYLGMDFGLSTAAIISLWLVVYGGGSLVHGFLQKQHIMAVIGTIWLFAAVHLVAVPSLATNAYAYFGLIAGLSFALGGIFAKKSS